MLLEEVADAAVAEGGSVQVPGNGVTAAPVATGAGAGVQRHPQAIAGVVLCAPHLGQIPVRAQVTSAHFGVRLEAATGEHHRPHRQLRVAARALHPQPGDAARAAHLKSQSLRLVTHLNAGAERQLKKPVGKARAATDGFCHQSAPETPYAADRERLAAVHEHPADAALTQPAHRWQGFFHQHIRQSCICQPFGHAHQVALKFGGAVAPDVDRLDFGGGKVGDQRADVLQAVVREAEGGAREVGIAAAQVLRRFLQDQHTRSRLAGGKRRAEGGIAGAGDDDVPACRRVYARTQAGLSWLLSRASNCSRVNTTSSARRRLIAGSS